MLVVMLIRALLGAPRHQQDREVRPSSAWLRAADGRADAGLEVEHARACGRGRSIRIDTREASARCGVYEGRYGPRKGAMEGYWLKLWGRVVIGGEEKSR